MYKIPDQVVQFIENQESGIISRRKTLSRGKDPKRLIPGIYTIIITICDGHDVTQQYIWEMDSRIKTQKIAENDQSLDVHGRHQTFCQKRKRFGNLDTKCGNIQSRYRIRFWCGKRHHAGNEMCQTTCDERSWTTKSSCHQNARRKGSLQILGEQVEMKEKIKKEYLRRTRKLPETKHYSSNLVKWKKHLGCPCHKIFGTLLQVDQRKN